MRRYFANICPKMSQLLHPQEIEVFYVLPTIRRSFATYMKQRGLSQKDIALILCIRESTVSQYIKDKRGSTIKFSESIESALKTASEIIKSKDDVIRETQKILFLVRSSGELCKIHKSVAKIHPDCEPSNMRCV